MADAHDKAYIYGPITPDQAKALRDGGYESAEAQAILQGLGAVADEYSVALVMVDPAETWSVGPGRLDGQNHYVTLNPSDIGTLVMPGLDADLGLPPAEQALDTLMSPENIIRQ